MAAGEDTIDAVNTNRPVPPLPGPPGERIRLLIDTDAANEIDDLYAIALALRSPDRFAIAGFVATHFAAIRGRETIAESYEAIREVLHAAGADYPIAMGGDPLCYPGEPRDSEGARFIVEAAHAMPDGEGLIVLALGAASNVASALLLDPSIAERVTVMFHGRSEKTWPERSTQFNIMGDIIAATHLLESRAPLIWFDTGTKLVAPMSETERRLAPAGRLGAFLHDYRYRHESYQKETKGFFDLGDVAWLIEPSLCSSDVIPAPTLTRWMYFDHTRTHGRMRFVSKIDVRRTWELFYERVGCPEHTEDET